MSRFIRNASGARQAGVRRRQGAQSRAAEGLRGGGVLCGARVAVSARRVGDRLARLDVSPQATVLLVPHGEVGYVADPIPRVVRCRG